MTQKMIIEVTFKHTLSPHGEMDIKRAVHEFKEGIEWLGTVTRADLVTVPLPAPPTETQK